MSLRALEFSSLVRFGLFVLPFFLSFSPSNGFSQTAPDLVPTAISATPAGTTNITITDTVRNTGNVDAGAFTISYYFGPPGAIINGGYYPDATPTSGGTLLCTRAVTSLAAGASDGPVTTTCAHNLPIPTNGRYSVYAVVDAGGTVGEIDETNHRLAAAIFPVVIGPDLVPTAISATSTGTAITINYSLKNQGNVDVPAFNVAFYPSVNAYWDGSDPLLCTDVLSGLQAGASDPPTGTKAKICTTNGMPAGTYSLFIVVDTGNGVSEIDETNNVMSTIVKVGAGQLIEDLDPDSGAVGCKITINGANFGSTRGANYVAFTGANNALVRVADPSGYISWGATSIVVYVPQGAVTGPVRVWVDGVPTNGETFTVTTTCKEAAVDYDITAFEVQGEVEGDETVPLDLWVLNRNDSSNGGATLTVVGKYNGVEFYRFEGRAIDACNSNSPTCDAVATHQDQLPAAVIPAGVKDDECVEFIATLTDADPDVDEVAARGTDDDDDEAKGCTSKTRFRWTSPNNAESFKIGSIIPLKFRLEDKATGLPISDARAIISIAKVNSKLLPEIPATTPNALVGDTGTLFRFEPGNPSDPTDDVYVFNWDTIGLTAGTWRVRVDLGDGKPHHRIIKLKVK